MVFPSYLIFCVLLNFFGLGLQRSLKLKGAYFPVLIPGFEIGILGIGLVSAAYGMDPIGKIVIIALEQGTFIWLIYVALLIG